MTWSRQSGFQQLLNCHMIMVGSKSTEIDGGSWHFFRWLWFLMLWEAWQFFVFSACESHDVSDIRFSVYVACRKLLVEQKSEQEGINWQFNFYIMGIFFRHHLDDFLGGHIVRKMELRVTNNKCCQGNQLRAQYCTFETSRICSSRKRLGHPRSTMAI